MASVLGPQSPPHVAAYHCLDPQGHFLHLEVEDKISQILDAILCKDPNKTNIDTNKTKWIRGKYKQVKTATNQRYFFSFSYTHCKTSSIVVKVYAVERKEKGYRAKKISPPLNLWSVTLPDLYIKAITVQDITNETVRRLSYTEDIFTTLPSLSSIQGRLRIYTPYCKHLDIFYDNSLEDALEELELNGDINSFWNEVKRVNEAHARKRLDIFAIFMTECEKLAQTQKYYGRKVTITSGSTRYQIGIARSRDKCNKIPRLNFALQAAHNATLSHPQVLEDNTPLFESPDPTYALLISTDLLPDFINTGVDTFGGDRVSDSQVQEAAVLTTKVLNKNLSKEQAISQYQKMLVVGFEKHIEELKKLLIKFEAEQVLNEKGLLWFNSYTSLMMQMQNISNWYLNILAMLPELDNAEVAFRKAKAALESKDLINFNNSKPIQITHKFKQFHEKFMTSIAWPSLDEWLQISTEYNATLKELIAGVRSKTSESAAFQIALDSIKEIKPLILKYDTLYSDPITVIPTIKQTVIDMFKLHPQGKIGPWGTVLFVTNILEKLSLNPNDLSIKNNVSLHNLIAMQAQSKIVPLKDLMCELTDLKRALINEISINKASMNDSTRLPVKITTIKRAIEFTVQQEEVSQKWIDPAFVMTSIIYRFTTCSRCARIKFTQEELYKQAIKVLEKLPPKAPLNPKEIESFRERIHHLHIKGWTLPKIPTTQEELQFLCDKLKKGIKPDNFKKKKT